MNDEVLEFLNFGLLEFLENPLSQVFQTNSSLIKIFSLPGGILVIGIVAFVVSKKGYTRAATSGA